MRGLEPKVREMIMHQRLYRAEHKPLAPGVRAALLLGNTACFIGGMGTDRFSDISQALSFAVAAAREHGGTSAGRDAGAILYRFAQRF